MAEQPVGRLGAGVVVLPCGHALTYLLTINHANPLLDCPEKINQQSAGLVTLYFEIREG